MIAKSSERVVKNTSARANERIRDQLELSITHHSRHPEQIGERLRELDEEWDIERVLMTMSASASLLGLVLGVTRRRRWLLAPVVVQGFLLQHALQGWCPPLPLLRRLGVRTQQEIEEERYALRAIRGESKRGLAKERVS